MEEVGGGPSAEHGPGGHRDGAEERGADDRVADAGAKRDPERAVMNEKASRRSWAPALAASADAAAAASARSTLRKRLRSRISRHKLPCHAESPGKDDAVKSAVRANAVARAGGVSRRPAVSSAQARPSRGRARPGRAGLVTEDLLLARALLLLLLRVHREDGVVAVEHMEVQRSGRGPCRSRGS